MPLVRRYADWRPVATHGIPAQLLGALAGLLVVAPLVLLFKGNWYAYCIPGGFVAHWVTSRLAERRMKELRDDPAGGQFAVSLRLVREVDYGFDEGLVAFEDGWLVYSGRRCAFSVRREDALDLIVGPRRHGFLFMGEAGRCAAVFQTGRAAHFGGAFRAWAEAKGVPGEAVLPPSRPTGEARALHRAWTWVGLVVSLVGLVAFYFQAKWSDRLSAGLVAALALPLTAFYGAQARLALERLDAGLPYRRHRLARRLNLRPVRRTQATIRAYALKAARERAAREPLGEGRAEALPEVDGVLRQGTRNS